MKIFLSYGHDINAPLVKRIKEDLATQGHEVWIDTAEIKSGDDWRHSITDGILKSDGVLAFLSEHSVRDPGVCRDELTIALGMKSGAIKTVLLESPDNVKPPLSVSHIQYLDMSAWAQHYDAENQHWDEPWYQEKLSEILRVITHPDSQKFAGEIETLKEKLKPVPYAPRVGQLLKQGFIGREWLKDQIEKWRTNSPDSRVFCITGDPGIGKSAFMAYLSTVSKAEVVGVHFCEVNKPNDSSPASVIRSLACQMASRLPDYRRFLLAELPNLDLDKLNPDELFERLINNAAHHGIDGGRERYLLLLDALDESGADLVRILTQKKDQLPAWLGVVVTSRPNEPSIKPFLQGLYPVEVQADGEENIKDAQGYIEQWLDLDVPSLSPDRKKELTKELLSASAGNFLWLSIFRAEVKTKPELLDNPEAYPRGLTALYYAFFVRRFGELNVDETRKKKYQDYQKPMLRLLVASRQAIPETLLKQILKWDKETLETEVFLPLGSLFKREPNGISAFHKSVIDFLTDPQRSGAFFVDSEQGHLQLAQILWADLVKAEGATDKLSDYLLHELPYQLAQVSQEERADIVGGVEGWEMHSQLVNKLYFEANENIQWKLAQAWSELRLQLNEELLGSEHSNTATALNNLAELFRSQGNSGAALPLYERALAISEKVEGPEHPCTATVLNNLARLFDSQGNAAAALPLFERALAIREKVQGPEHPDTASTLNNLASLFDSQGNFDAALPLFERALAIQEKVLGPEHPGTSLVLNNLAGLFKSQGNTSAALPLFERALAISEKVQGPEHPSTATSLNNLAELYCSQGNTGAALPLYERALAINENVLGPEHPDTAILLGNLAILFQTQGNTGAAMPLFERALAIQEKVLGPEHPSTAQTLSNLAFFLFDQGNTSAALPLFERVLAIREKVLGLKHPDTLFSLDILAGMFIIQDNIVAALPLYERVLKISEDLLGPEHPDTVTALNKLVDLYATQGNFSAALPLAERVLAIREKVLGPKHSDTISAFDTLAKLKKIIAPSKAKPQTFKLFKKILVPLIVLLFVISIFGTDDRQNIYTSTLSKLSSWTDSVHFKLP